MRISLPLLNKEIRQNALVYFLLPLPFWLGSFSLRLVGHLSLRLSQLICLVAPFTLALAYGLQAFDIEEDAQTRDFLLVKPLSVGEIIWHKFLLGLGMLIFWLILFLLALRPDFAMFPQPLQVASWMAFLITFGAVVSYGTCFFFGLFVHGTRKLLAAACGTVLGFIWAFFTWSGLFTFFVHRISSPLILGMVFYLSSLFVISVLVGLYLSLTAWFLRGSPPLARFRSFLLSLVAILTLPTLALSLNFLLAPPLRVANFLGLELFGADPAFWVIDGAWRPGGEELAVVGPANSLALARPGKKPQRIYQGKPLPGHVLQDLAWSPDGRNLAFVEEGEVCVLALGSNKPLHIGPGSAPCWDHTGHGLLLAREVAPPRRVRTPEGAMVLYTYDLFYADLVNKTLRPYLQLVTPNAKWTWEARKDLFLTVDSFGRIYGWNREGTRTVPLPGFELKRGGIFWHKFYPIPGRKEEYLLALLVLTGEKKEEYNAYFYRFDVKAFRPFFLKRLSRLRANNLFCNPGDGVCFLGTNGIYRQINLYK
ncbi:MAG: hypothetical protein ACUVRM_03830 [Bacillota bacterium]